MTRRNVGLFLALLLTFGSMSFGQIKPDRATGVEGVVTVSPTRPGPVRAESEIPNAAPLPNAVFTVRNERGTVTSFTTDRDRKSVV